MGIRSSSNDKVEMQLANVENGVTETVVAADKGGRHEQELQQISSITVTVSTSDENTPSKVEQVKDAGGKSVEVEVHVPIDKYKMVYLIMILHGVGTLMPWNMFINAKDYFEKYKLGDTQATDARWYSTHFFQFLLPAAQLPNLVFSWVNIIFPCGGSLKKRIIISLIIELFVCCLTVVLAAVNTSQTPALFFWLTMMSVVVISTAGGFYQNSVYGIAAKVGYTGAIVIGSNLSGVFTSVTNLVVHYTATSDSTSALFYFGTATCTLLLCLVSYLHLPSIKFYRYCNPNPTGEVEKVQNEKQNLENNQWGNLFSVLKVCWPQCFNVFMVFFVSLAIFPAIQSNVKVLDNNFVIADPGYFLDVTCFLTFNLFAFIGNLCADWVQFPKSKYLWIAVTLRLLFIPFFLMCNYHPLGFTRSGTVLFGDWSYWVAGILLGLTNGYFSSLAMMYCPRSVEKKHAPIAGMFGAAFLVTGVFVGVNFSTIMPYFVGS